MQIVPHSAQRHREAARQRRAWDSNPRGRANALAVFKTAAIGH